MNENGITVAGIRRNDLFHRIGRAVLPLAMVWCVIWFVPQAVVGGEIAEVEPNNSPAQANALAPGQFGLGGITFTFSMICNCFQGNEDQWRSSAAIDDLVFAFADAQESTELKDPFLSVRSNDTSTLETDSEDGPPASPGSSAVVAGAVVVQAGNVYYLVGGATSSTLTSISPYRLYQAVVNPADSAAEQEGNNTVAAANPITARMMTGTVSGADVDFYKVYVRTGQRLVVIMDDNPDDDATYTDTDLSILGVDGTTILATGDNLGFGGTGAGDANAAGAIIAPSTGIYYIRVAHGGEFSALDTDYRFVVLVDGATVVDRDTDGVADSADNCPDVATPGQENTDADSTGDACDTCTDTDGDGFGNPGFAANTCAVDNCPDLFNADQADADADGVGDACELPAPPPPDAACGTCAQGVMPASLACMALLCWGRHSKRCARRFKVVPK